MNASNIALIANIGEIIAALLVVVSLAYVALQIRQNTHALKVTAATNSASIRTGIRCGDGCHSWAPCRAIGRVRRDGAKWRTTDRTAVASDPAKDFSVTSSVRFGSKAATQNLPNSTT